MNPHATDLCGDLRCTPRHRDRWIWPG